MKLLSVLLGICFVFSISQKTFACPCEDKAAGKAPASTTVADAKDVTADATAEKTCACAKDGKACACGKDGKACDHKDGKACNHKDGKSCACGKEKKST